MKKPKNKTKPKTKRPARCDNFKAKLVIGYETSGSSQAANGKSYELLIAIFWLLIAVIQFLQSLV